MEKLFYQSAHCSLCVTSGGAICNAELLDTLDRATTKNHYIQIHCNTMVNEVENQRSAEAVIDNVVDRTFSFWSCQRPRNIVIYYILFFLLISGAIGAAIEPKLSERGISISTNIALLAIAAFTALCTAVCCVTSRAIDRDNERNRNDVESNTQATNQDSDSTSSIDDDESQDITPTI